MVEVMHSEKEDKCTSIFFDLAKASVTVDRAILLDKFTI